MRNTVLYDLCQVCDKKNCDHTNSEANICSKAISQKKGKWNKQEYQIRRVAWYNAIPKKGCITEQDHKELFPYGPSVYRDTKKDVLNVYKQFVIYNKINSTYARDNTVQERLI